MHPYRSQPDKAFWNRFVAGSPWLQVDIAPDSRPVLHADTRVATAGSCFASNLVKWLPSLGLTPFVTEQAPGWFSPAEAEAHHYGDFSARYGNIYTVRQLRQLVEQALGERGPIDEIDEVDGAWFDLLRPHIRAGGFKTLAEARQDRRYHLRCVERLLRECDVFVFTLGLTEAWVNGRTGTVYAVCPGTVAGTFDPAVHLPVNFDYPAICEDLTWTIDAVTRVNPSVQWVVTVSPVSMVATHTDDNILVASMYSKSVLRAVCGAVSKTRENVTYFPGYEIVAAPQSFGQYLTSNLREVTERGMRHVLEVFGQTFVACPPSAEATLSPRPTMVSTAAGDALADVQAALDAECDELLNDPG
ncbi:MAG: GSCFA domain-containing protein [Acidimicrobiales bacterium]